MSGKQPDLEKFLSDLEYLVNIDSGTSDPEGVSKVASFFTERFSALGWKVEAKDLHSSVGPCLEITSPGCGDHYEVMLLGHMDTVFPKGTVAERPFRIEGEKAYGPGVVDMKSGCLFALNLAQDLTQSSEAVPSICIALNSHEEIGSRHARPWIEELAKKSSNVLVLEPARANGDLVNERKGLGRFTVSFHGKAAHAGVEPEKGASATNELAHWILEVHALTDWEKGTNLNAGLISGGTSSNAVAEKAEAVFDLRVKSMDEAERVLARIEELKSNPFTPGVTVQVDGGLTRPPMNPSEETLYLCRKVDAAGEELGLKIGWQATGGGSDGNFSGALGVPTVDGMGPVGGRSHSSDEYLELDTLQQRYAFLKRVIEGLTNK